MAETVPGGRYCGADGQLHDANGKHLDPDPSPDEAAKAEQVAAAAPKGRKK